MARELFSMWGGNIGWYSDATNDVTATLYSKKFYFHSEKKGECERAFYRAARKAFFHNLFAPVKSDRVKMAIATAVFVLIVLALAGLSIWWQWAKYEECHAVGHSHLYCLGKLYLD
jgi:hypothetical protein